MARVVLGVWVCLSEKTAGKKGKTAPAGKGPKPAGAPAAGTNKNALYYSVFAAALQPAATTLLP